MASVDLTVFLRLLWVPRITPQQINARSNRHPLRLTARRSKSGGAVELNISLAPNANLCKLRNTETSCVSQDD
jgi:hypothetical protein